MTHPKSGKQVCFSPSGEDMERRLGGLQWEQNVKCGKLDVESMEINFMYFLYLFVFLST